MHDKIKKYGKAGLAVLALTMNQDIQEGAGALDLFLRSFRNISLLSVVLFFLLARMMSEAETLMYKAEKTGTALCSRIPAAFFAFCMVFGYSFYKCNSWELVFGSRIQVFKSGIAFAGYYCLFHAVVVFFYCRMERLAGCPGNAICLQEQGGVGSDPFRSLVGWYLKRLSDAPFCTSFLTLFIAFLPYMALSYPAIFTCDTRIQLDNGYSALIFGTGHLRNQHPVLHTLLLVLASLGGNAGIFLLSLAQTLLTVGAMAWTIRYLAERKIPAGRLAGLLLFFVCNPRIQNYLFTLVKDVWYGAFFMIFLVEFHRILTGWQKEAESRKKHLALLFLAITGVLFFRQDSVYVLAVVMLAAGIFKKENRKLFMGMLVAVLLVSAGYQRCVLPALQVSDNNTRQFFSIPFQQTARYVRDAEEEVTEEEARAIAGVLDYENLGELYNPNLSDPVKSTFNRDAGAEELLAYFKVWAQMFFKRPDIYLQATMNNLYGYFYPDGYVTQVQDYGSSADYMREFVDHNAERNVQVNYPEALSEARGHMEYLREMIFQLPVLSSLNLSASYIWILILAVFYSVRRKDRDSLLVLLPLFMVFLVCMAGPAYGWYFRYLYPIALCLPGVMLMDAAAASKK